MKKVTCFVASKQCSINKKHLATTESVNFSIGINTTYCQPANLIPHFWNYKIVDKEGGS